jgi:molybdenum cofactor cytidylyltransferase
VRVVDNALASRARPGIVVTGHEHARVEEALAGRAVQLVHAPDFAAGLSASLKAGLLAMPQDIEGVVICLGDMPLVAGPTIDRLLASFDPAEGRAIVMPTFRGKQGNPMLWSAEFLPEMMTINGDVGARHLAGKYTDRVVEVEMADDAVLRDFDTTEALRQAPGFGGRR